MIHAHLAGLWWARIKLLLIIVLSGILAWQVVHFAVDTIRDPRLIPSFLSVFVIAYYLFRVPVMSIDIDRLKHQIAALERSQAMMIEAGAEQERQLNRVLGITEEGM